MKKAGLFIAVVLFFGLIYSQETETKRPDYKKIEKEIKKKKSAFHYKKLFKRYIGGDTTFTIEEKRHLYYGFSFQDKYSPYGLSPYSDSLRGILEKPELTGADYQSIISLSNLILENNPFDLRTLNYLAYASGNIGDTAQEEDCIYKTFLIIDAIMSTGDGISEETAFSVIYVAHEYDLLDILGFQFGGEQSLITTGYDYLTLAENEFGIEGFYFEISRCLNALDGLFK